MVWMRKKAHTLAPAQEPQFVAISAMGDAMQQECARAAASLTHF